jgi:aryl-alcohol dehydrogenase-like predicted oxidoreductase
MKRRIVPGTDLNASILCLGTADFGSVVDDSRSRAILDHYIDQGGNVIDTAEAYASWLPDGSHRSEEFLGKWLKERGRPTELIISTKGGHPRFESMHIPRMSRKEVTGDLDSSLLRLGVDSIDIYWLHRDDPRRPVEEFLMMVDDFRRAGKIRYAGFSNWMQDRAEVVRIAAQKLNLKGFVASQSQWSLANSDLTKGDRTLVQIDQSYIEWHKKNEFPLFPYSTQALGYFRRLETGTIDRAPSLVRDLFHHTTNQRAYERIKSLRWETGLSLSQIMLGYLLGHPFPVFPILGPKKVEDLQQLLKAKETTLAAEQISFLQGRT